MKRIRQREQLATLADTLGVRPDWHEPDEQEVTATMYGSHFDNAGFWGDEPWASSNDRGEITEQYVVLRQAGTPVAAVNLATLFAWAADVSAGDDLRYVCQVRDDLIRSEMELIEETHELRAEAKNVRLRLDSLTTRYGALLARLDEATRDVALGCWEEHLYEVRRILDEEQESR